MSHVSCASAGGRSSRLSRLAVAACSARFLVGDCADADQDVVVGFGSCLMTSKFPAHERQGYRPFTILSKLAEKKMDGFIFMGDAVYADFPDFYSTGCCSRPPFPTCRASCFESGRIGTAEKLDAQYDLLLQDEHFARFVRTVPTVFTWDDHELFDNYREGTQHQYYHVARAAFDRHLAHRYNPAPYRAGEMYFSHSVPNGVNSTPMVDFFVLDGRSHRSRQGLLGEQQIADLGAWLATPTRARWRFIVSSTMFADVASGIGSDNWSMHPEEKRRVLSIIHNSGVEGVLLLSGDAHFLAIVEHRLNWGGGQCRLVEVCSSPLASVPLTPKEPAKSYNGKRHGFEEDVKFFKTGDHLYATAHLNANTATLRLWSYQDGPKSPTGHATVGQETLLAEARVARGPVCTAPPGSAGMGATPHAAEL
eukprot:TRINITY_DN36348_c0_g1_i1.p1 TRINITY_DN36348_c0_g1~~TRINITY_DN36348_c0_g1_i1.p1  ORF type:complete len:422 (-),score=46.10 TRINITY_DN36348_c0_g1_i1:87-1352(-)